MPAPKRKAKIEGPLADAIEAVFNREENYGHPADNMGQIAEMWNALFDVEFTAADVALAMVCLKLSRLYRTPGHSDSAVDVAGYIQAYWMIVNDDRS